MRVRAEVLHGGRLPRGVPVSAEVPVLVLRSALYLAFLIVVVIPWASS